MVTKRENAFVGFVLGGLSLVFRIYLLMKTKNNTNERYEDERKKFVSAVPPIDRLQCKHLFKVNMHLL